MIILTNYLCESRKTFGNKTQEIFSEIFNTFSFIGKYKKHNLSYVSFNILLSPSYYLHEEQLSGFVGGSGRSLQIKTKIKNNYLFLKPVLIKD
jgi:hypothetical protein